MKLDTKSFFLAAACFAAGFLLCLALVSPAPRQQSSSPVMATAPMLAFTQFQPRPFHLTQVFVPPGGLLPRPVIRGERGYDPQAEIEMMKHRSLDLIDTRDQSQIELKESKK
jgi:hypothetical protein